MKKKIIIIVTAVVVIALSGTLVFAAVGEDGNLVNPFAKLLTTQEEANIFTNVWDTIKGEARNGRDKSLQEKHSEINQEFMEEFKEAMSAKANEVIDNLVASGVITKEDAKSTDGKRLHLGAFLKDADEVTKEAVQEEMFKVKDFMNEYLDKKVLDGTITQEQADRFHKAEKDMGKPSGGKMRKSNSRRMPGKTDDSNDSQTNPDS